MSNDKWHRVRQVHTNSVSAYYEGLLDSSFSKREALILDALKDLGSATDREILDQLLFNDMNAVRPRITELINDAGILEECGHKYDSYTEKNVRIVRIIKDEDQRQLKLFNN